MNHRPVIVICLFASLVLGDDEVIPKAVTAATFGDMLRHSPFNRPLNRPGSIVLTGCFVIDGKPTAVVKQTETGKTLLVTDTANEKGWRLLELLPASNLSRMAAKIELEGGEVVEIRYDEATLKPLRSKSGATEIRVPTEVDRRPIPTDDERKKFGEYVKGRFGTMSDEQKQRVGQLFGEKLKDNPSMSDRQKGELFYKVLNTVAPEQK